LRERLSSILYRGSEWRSLKSTSGKSFSSSASFRG
jgi:hypothetical protein